MEVFSLISAESLSTSGIWRLAGLLSKDLRKTSVPEPTIYVAGLRGIPEIQGGVERHCQNLFPRIVRLGLQVTLFARSGYVVPKESSYKGVRIIPLYTIRTSSLEAIAHTGMAVLQAKRMGSKLFHLHGIGPAIWAPFASRLGMKVVVTHHGFDYRRQKWGAQAKSVLQKGETNAIRYADGLICISKEITDFVRSKNPRGTVVQIPNGVEIPTAIPDVSRLDKWNLKSRSYFLLTARFVQEKGITDLIRAWHASGIADRCSLAIAGGEDHPSSYGEEIRTLARETGAVLTGVVGGDDLKAIYGHARGFVLPSFHEGLPISLLEAMSYGLPLGASNIMANLEVGLATETYFTPGNIDEIGQRLRSMLEEPERQDHSILMRAYDWDQIAEATVSLYRELLG